MQKSMKGILWGIFLLYLLLLTYQLLMKYYSISQIGRLLLFQEEGLFFLKEVNLVPFHTIQSYVQIEGTTFLSAMRNLIGNVIGFVPFGFFAGLLIFKRPTWLKVIGATFMCSLFYETIQYIFTLGLFDVDDLLLNTLGGAIGYGCYWIMKRYLGRLKRNRITTQHSLR